MGITEISGASTTVQLATTRSLVQTNEGAAVREATKPPQGEVKSQANDKQARPEELQSALQKIQSFVSATTSDINFTIDGETGNTVVKVIDSSTKEVIRQIPSQEFLEMAKALDRLQGLLVKNQA